MCAIYFIHIYLYMHIHALTFTNINRVKILSAGGFLFSIIIARLTDPSVLSPTHACGRAKDRRVSSPLRRCLCYDGQCMHTTFQLIRKRFVHRAMPLHQRKKKKKKHASASVCEADPFMQNKADVSRRYTSVCMYLYMYVHVYMCVCVENTSSTQK